MRLVGIRSCLLLAVAGVAVGCGGEQDRTSDEREVAARFVRSWPAGGPALARTIVGPDVPRMVETLASLTRAGVAHAKLVRASQGSDGSGSIVGFAALRFEDGGRLALRLRAIVDDDRVRAEPAAISTKLRGWEKLRVDEFGRREGGKIRSRSGAPLTVGPAGRTAAVRPALAPAVTLIRKALGPRLAGSPGLRLLAGNPPRVLARSEPVAGLDIATTLDDGMQAAAERVLRDASGALVAVDPRSGGIRALVSNPAESTPHRSPATAAYSPGSTFKLVTAAAGLESGVIDAADVVSCPPQTAVDEAQITNFGGIGYGPITFQRAFAVSCNTAFAQVGVVIGATRLLETAQDLGFRVGTLDRPGRIAVPGTRGELGVLSYGAAGSLVSPVQLAGIGATIARGGLSVSPGWLDRGIAGERVLSEGTADAVVSMMEAVVASGTGRRAALPGVRLAGKTGTAEPDRGDAGPDSWFVALAPSREARLVVVGFLPGGGLGGDLAASLVREFLLATVDTWRYR